MSIEIGDKAPDIALENQDGEKVRLADFAGKNIVLYFYPKDMTPGCTTEACDFRDHHDTFEAADTVIVGVSPDPVDKHQKFIDKYGLPFQLLADINHDMAEAYGVWKLKKMFGKEFYGNERSTFIIDKEGVVREVYRKVKVEGHVEAALAFIEENLNAS